MSAQEALTRHGAAPVGPGGQRGHGAAAPALDRLVAGASLVLLSPAIVTRAALSYARTGKVLARGEAVGRHGDRFPLYTFQGGDPGATLPHLLAVATGHMRFIGPRPLTPAENGRLTEEDEWRRAAAPGIFSAHRLRSQMGIAYGTEAEHDQALLEDASLTNPDNLGLIARSVVAGLVAGNADHREPDTFDLLGVRIANTTMSEAVDWVMSRARQSAVPGSGQLLCFVNPGCLNLAVEHDDYRDILDRAAMVLPDGIGLKVATRMQTIGLRENVNGTDMFPLLCERAAAEGVSLYLLGARDGVARAAADAMQERYPGLRIAGTHHGYVAGIQNDVIADINAAKPGILLVAMGVPQQERWLDRHHHQLAVPMMMGVGGLFDFYSGRIPRAPLWLREMGLEWAWRLAQEPRRMWRRYVIGNPLFLYRVWREHRTALRAGDG